MNTDFPLWMEIQAEHLRTNYELLKRSAQQDGQAQIMGVVKADAYGHGTECVTLLQQYGMDRFGVASVQEGEILRKEGITGSIYLLGGFIAEEIPGILTYGLIPVLSSPDEFESLAQMANQQQHDLDFHLKIDTGMGRMGFLPDDLHPKFLRRMTSHPRLHLRGIMTHFASSENDPVYTRKQYGLFSQTVQSFCQYTGLSPDSLEKHCCNSAGFLFFPPYHGQMIRLGIALFGVSPTLDPQDVRSRGLRPVMSIKGRIKHLKTLPPDFCVGYGSTWVTRRETRIAVIPIGYAQGLFRSLSNHCDVLVRGKRAKCIGTISMDQIMVDITDIPGVEKGDLVTILGQDGNDEIRAEELAVRANTIPHEILCSFVRIKNRITV